MSNMEKAQAAYDNREPEDEECDHNWNYLGTDPEGESYFKCRKCGMESES
jgi:hypothetical protein